MRVAHDVGLLDVTILGKESVDIFFGETRMDTGDEKVGSGVASLLFLLGVEGC